MFPLGALPAGPDCYDAAFVPFDLSAEGMRRSGQRGVLLRVTKHDEVAN